MLSLHTNIASMRIQGALGNTQQNLTTSMTRLGTGYRINAASDDAAGLQIATRLLSQSRGMQMASQNAQNATSMLQTAEGAFAEVESILHRMKDLATQAADSAWTDEDRKSLQKEYDALGTELKNIIDSTSYGGEKLFAQASGASGASGMGGKLTTELTFQIGNTSGETMKLNVSRALTDVVNAFKAASQEFNGASGASGHTDITTASGANALLDSLSGALSSVGGIRAEIGAGQNRLSHITANLSNMTNNTKDAEGRIRDVDYASETANMTKLNILQQAGGSMLKQASQMSQLVLSLLQ